MDQAEPISSCAASAPPNSIPRPLPLVDRLYAATLRRTIWPLMNYTTGRSIHRKMRFLEQSQWWPRERLEAYQLAKLRRLMSHVYDHVPFYGREMLRRGLRPDDFTSLDVLREMPIVTKAMLQANSRDFLSGGYRLEDLITGMTSGSTGEPTRFYRTREQDSWHWALKYRMWGMAGYRLGLPYVNVYNNMRPDWKKRFQDRLLRNTPIYVFQSPDQNAQFAAAVAALSRSSVQFLAGCTTPLRLLAEYHAVQPSFPSLHLRAILSTGNVLTAHERQIIERHLGAPVWDHYGLGGEGAHVAAECEYKNGYHMNVENVLVEPTDPAAARAGHSTGLLVTVLDNLGWPLIRYDSGDCANFTDRRCACGRGLSLLERIAGRVSEIIALRNGVRLTAHYFAIIGHCPEVRQYQVEQTELDRLVIRVVWQTGVPSVRAKQAIVAALQQISGNTVHVEFEDVLDVPQARGKHRYIIGLAANEDGTLRGLT